MSGKKIKLCILFLGTSLSLFLSSCDYKNTSFELSSLYELTWQFSESSQHQFDSNYIEITSQGARLKSLDLIDSGNDFNSGTLQSAVVTQNQLGLLNPGTSENLFNILPHRSANLTGYWRIDGDFQDSSGNANHASVVNNITRVPGRINEAAHMDGANSHLQVLDDDSLDNTNQLTITFWWQPYDLATGFDALFSKRVGSNNNQAYTIWYRSQSIIVDFDGNNDRFTSNKTDLEPGKWYHITLVYDGTAALSSRMSLYINGVLDIVAAESSATLPNYASNLLIGQDHTAGGQDIMGLMDEVAIFNTSLSVSDIQSIYDNQSLLYSEQTELSSLWTPKWDDVVGYWKFDENWQDSSKNTRNCTPTNAPVFTTSGSKIGSAHATFDGVNQSCDIGTGVMDFINTSSFSSFAWVRTTSSAQNYLFGTNVDTGWYLRIHTGAGSVLLAKVDDGVNDYVAQGTTAINDGAWHHIGLVKKVDELLVYVDGKLEGQIAIGALNDLDDNFHIGRVNFNYAEADLDDIAVWSEELTTSEIKTIYQRQKHKYSASYSSPVIDLGRDTSTWFNFDWTTPLPFGKELVVDSNDDGSIETELASDYALVDGSYNANIVGHWSFNESAANTAPGSTDFKDLSINDNHASETGGVLFGEKGKFGNAVFFDGSDDHVILPSLGSDFWRPRDRAFGFWFQLHEDSFLTRSDLFNIYANSFSFVRVSLYTDATKNLSFRYRFCPSCVNKDITGPAIEPGEWYHVVVSWDANDFFLYLNGALVGQLSDSFVPIDNLALTTVGGNIDDNNFFKGRIDELSVWSKALTPEQVAQLYRRGGNQSQLQVKSCIDSTCQCREFNTSPVGSENDCDGDGTLNNVDYEDSYKSEFTGAGGSSATTFPEIYNRSDTDINFNCSLNATDSDATVCVDDEIELLSGPLAGAPGVNFSDYPAKAKPPANRYIQYRVNMGADTNTACSGSPCQPQITQVNLDSSNTNRFHGALQEITPTKYISYSDIRSATIDAEDCAAFQLSPDGANYFYWSGSNWSPASLDSHTTSKIDLSKQISKFASQLGPGKLYLKALLQTNSDQSTNCEIKSVDIDFAR